MSIRGNVYNAFHAVRNSGTIKRERRPGLINKVMNILFAIRIKKD
jgi:hypothetical protein